MSVVNSIRQFRVALVYLLFICMSAAATTTQWQYSWEASGADSKAVLFTSILARNAGTALADGQRTRLNCFDNLLKASIIHLKILIIFTRESSAFLSKYKATIAHSTGRTAIPTRAPPHLNSC